VEDVGGGMLECFLILVVVFDVCLKGSQGEC